MNETLIKINIIYEHDSWQQNYAWLEYIPLRVDSKQRVKDPRILTHERPISQPLS